MKKEIIKLVPNRVRRNYKGGKTLDLIQNGKVVDDSNMPEDWICSLILANNVGFEEIKDEGYSSLDIDGKKMFIKDIFASDTTHYLGEKHFEHFGMSLGFLTKFIDSSMRLHVQAHPSREFAKSKMNMPYGKFECYYILAAREGIDPYIRLGFQKEISKESFKEIVEKQDIEAMDACFEKVPVKVGDVVYIPGGLPHAIGEGILLIEVMEESDLVVRCEFEREGIVVPEQGRFMGKDLDFCLDVFDYKSYSVDEIRSKFFLNPEILAESSSYKLERIVSGDISKTFEVQKMTIKGKSTLELDERFMVAIVPRGGATVSSNDEKIELNCPDTFFVSAATKELTFTPKNNEECEIVFILPVME